MRKQFSLDIITAARDCIGTPFVHQGRVIGVGMDCAGVVIHAVRSIGIEAIDVVGYGRTPNKNQLADALDAQPALERVCNIADRMAGDILMMRFLGEPQHLAICTGEGVIHAYENVGACCEHRICSKWANRIVRVYRVKGLA